MPSYLQAPFFFLFLIACWFGGQAVHELGHVLAVWSSGANVEAVYMWPISQTVVSNRQYPLFEIGAGPVFGGAFPVLLWVIAHYWLRLKFAYIFRAFAALCLIFNGAYIGLDFTTTGALDGRLLIYYGAPRWTLILFGLVYFAAGMFLWRGQLKYFFDEQKPQE
jgi:hypothetical protein